MSEPIQYVVEWTIRPGETERFSELAREASRLVAANEPDMVGYHWYLDEDGEHCTLLEWYPDAEHLAPHRENMAAVLPRLLEVASMTVRAFGGLDDETRDALGARGVPYRAHVAGHTGGSEVS